MEKTVDNINHKYNVTIATSSSINMAQTWVILNDINVESAEILNGLYSNYRISLPRNSITIQVSE